MIAGATGSAIVAATTRVAAQEGFPTDPVSVVVLRVFDMLTPWWPVALFWLGAGVILGSQISSRLRGDIRRMLGRDGGITLRGLRSYARQARLQFRSGLFRFLAGDTEEEIYRLHANLQQFGISGLPALPCRDARTRGVNANYLDAVIPLLKDELLSYAALVAAKFHEDHAANASGTSGSPVAKRTETGKSSPRRKRQQVRQGNRAARHEASAGSTLASGEGSAGLGAQAE